MQEQKIITNQNFISTDFRTVRNSYGNFFTIGEEVEHEDDEAGKAIITGFGLDIPSNEIMVYTTKGFTHLDFVVKCQNKKE